MADIILNKRVDQLPLNAGFGPGFLLPVFNPNSGLLERMDISAISTAEQGSNFEWMTDTAYLEDDVRTYGGKWWQANQDVPINIVPGSNPAYWSELNKSPSGFVYWQSGVFTDANVFVLRALDSFIQIALLADPTRPFISTDFNIEYAQGKWDLMSETGYLGFVKSAHGFSLNDVLTFKDGAWNKFTTGDKPLALVKVIPNTDTAIVRLLGSRVKGFAGLTPGGTYYAQSNGTIGTTETANGVLVAISATEAVLLGGGVSGGGEPDPDPEALTWGDEVVLMGSTTVTFED